MAEKIEGTGMTSKQKLMAVVLLIVLVAIGWQMMGMFGSKGASTETITPVEKTPMMNNAPAANTPMGGNPPANQMPGGANAPMNQPPMNPMQNQMQTPTNQPVLQEIQPPDNQILEIQKESEQKYVDQLNQLQMLKIQREIAETNQAIASARLATVTAEKNVSDLLTTKPIQAPQPALIPPGAYANALMGGAPGEVPKEAVPAPPPSPPPPVLAEYVVISVSMQFGKWTAVLGAEGKLYNVSIGDVLPVDGSVVVSINKNGIVLMKDGKRRKVSMVSSI